MQNISAARHLLTAHDISLNLSRWNEGYLLMAAYTFFYFVTVERFLMTNKCHITFRYEFVREKTIT